MRDVTPWFLPALRDPHGVLVEVDAFYNRQARGPVPILAGRLTLDAGARYRRTVELTVDPRRVPEDPADLLSPYGAELEVRQGIVYPDGQTETVTVFYGPITQVEDTTPDGTLTLRAVDNTLRITDARLTVPRAASGAATTEITELIAGADPTAVVTFVDAIGAGTLVPDVVWDRDRDKAIDELVRAIGGQWYAEPTGPDAAYTVRAVPTLADPAVWTIDTGPRGVLVSTRRIQTRDGVYNAVVALGERSDGTPPVRALVTDDDPDSPLRYGGPFGRKPRFYASPLLNTTGQARSAAAALLAQSIGAARQRSLTCVPNPALEPGDVIEVAFTSGTGTDPGQITERHLVDAITLPLGVGGPMEVTTRSTRTTGGDEQ